MELNGTRRITFVYVPEESNYLKLVQKDEKWAPW